MKNHRIRLSDKEFKQWELFKSQRKKLFKVLIFSDCHGWLADLKALGAINRVLQHNDFDEVVINGDVVDLPYLSKHTKKLDEDGILGGYSEVGEIEYTKEQILKPLRASTDAEVIIRLGNHDERITKPHSFSKEQLERLTVLCQNYKTTEFDKILGLDELGMVYDPKPIKSYFDTFFVVHGLSLAQNAPVKNIIEYMASGTTGHSHRLSTRFLTNRKSPYMWIESGHTRIQTEVEYLPTAKVPNWQQGFVELVFSLDGDKPVFFASPHPIIEGKAFYNGVLY